MKNILKLFWLMFSYNQICMAFTDTKGRTFSLAFFPEYTFPPRSDARNILYFSSALDGGCTVSYNDGTRHQTNVHVIAGDVLKLALPDTTQLLTGTRVEHKAIYVNCSTEIALYGQNKFAGGTESSDAFTVLTEEMLSTDYLVASVEKTANLGVVATRDNTAISVTLNATCDYVFNSVQYGDGDTVSVTLGYGDVFQLGLASESRTDKCDLGGSRIHSNHMVAVFSGALYVRKPALAAGHMVSQVPPENAFTNTVIAPKVETDAPAGMTLRVLARENNTVVTVTREEANGTIVTSSTSLNTAEFEDINSDLSADVIIQSNRPIMCIQNIYFRRSGGSSLFVPGTDLYDNNYIVQSLNLDGVSLDGPFITIVSEVSSFMDVRVNGQQRDDIKWTNLTTVPYAVGVLRIQPKQPYVVNSSSPILVRLHERLYLESYSYNAGYRLPSSPEKLTGAIELKCLAKGWFVTLDVDVLHNVTLSHIYMGQSKCTGTLHGNQLIFNQSYTECHTETSVSNGMVMFMNRVMYVASSADNVVRHVMWVHSISCSEPVDGTNAVHIYPDFNETVTGSSTGHIQGPSFDISLFKDSSYQHLFSGNHAQAKIGEPVFVQVSSSVSPNTIMVLRSCDAQIGNGKEVPHPLIENGCAVDARTQILVTRNSVTRFEFEMFDLPEEQDGIYVTCHVTFCDQSDFSDKCKQQCHTSPPIIG